MILKKTFYIVLITFSISIYWFEHVKTANKLPKSGVGKVRFHWYDLLCFKSRLLLCSVVD